MPETTPQPSARPVDAVYPLEERRARPRFSIHPSRRKWVLAVLTLIMFSTTMDYMVIMPLVPRLMELFGITPKEFSFLVSIYSFSAGIFGLLGSLIFDRLDRKVSLVSSYLGFLIGTLFCAYAPGFGLLLAARAITGAFAGLLSGICYAIIGDLFPISERGLATGKLLTSYSLASIIGVPTGLYLCNHIGWHATFGSIVVLGTFALVVAIQVVPNGSWNMNLDPKGFFSGITENLSDLNARHALLTTLLMVHSQFVVIPFISAYLVSNTGFPASKLPHIYLLGGLMTVISGILMGKTVDRFGARRTFTKTGLLFLIPVFFVTHLNHASVAITLLITTAIFVFSNFRSVPAVTIISSSIPAARRGSFMSLNTCIHQLGAASGTFLAGWIVTEGSTQSLMHGFSNTAYLSIAFGVLAYFQGRRIRMIS
jgi:predicted MFS family arabinose efflux permease